MSHFIKLALSKKKKTMKTAKMDSPNEVLAVAAEGWMLEEPRDELVVFDLRDVLLLEGSLAGAGAARHDVPVIVSVAVGGRLVAAEGHAAVRIGSTRSLSRFAPGLFFLPFTEMEISGCCTFHNKNTCCHRSWFISPS